VKVKVGSINGEAVECECSRVKVNPAGWLIIEYEDGAQTWIPPHRIAIVDVEL
jgi:hypothetical protein